MIDYLTSNKDWLTLVVSIVVGLATVIATGVNAYLVYKQNEIYKEQIALQEKQNQPVFSFSMQLEQDLDDGKYGTEILTIRNVGHTMSQPCQIKVSVFFKITKTNRAKQDSLYFLIEDYFNMASKGNTGDDEVYYAKGSGNNRIYSNIYYAAIEASKETKPDSYYFIDKFILTKIEYSDIYGREHECFFMDKAEISKDSYDEIESQGYNDYRQNSLRNISFSEIKKIIDDIHK